MNYFSQSILLRMFFPNVNYSTWNVVRFHSILITSMIYRYNLHIYTPCCMVYIQVSSFVVWTQIQYVILFILGRYLRTKHYIQCKKYMEVNCFLFLLWIWNIARTGVSLRTSSYTKYRYSRVLYTIYDKILQNKHIWPYLL